MAANSCSHSSRMTAANAYRRTSALNFENSYVNIVGSDEVLEDVDKDDELWRFSFIGEFVVDFLPLLLPPPRNMEEIAAVIEFLVARASFPKKNNGRILFYDLKLDLQPHHTGLSKEFIPIICY